jgi:subtilisin family serine protease
VIKPPHATFDDRFVPGLLTVKFQDGLRVRVRDQQLTDFGSGELEPARKLLESLGPAIWRRVDELPEEQIDELRRIAQENLGCAIADVNLQFLLRLAPGTNVAAVIEAFNALEIVELAQGILRPGPLPVAPDFQPLQGYLQPPTGGINALATWSACGTRGTGIKVLDVECSFNPNHVDLAVTLVGGDLGFGGQPCEDHGTATLGILGSKDNGSGTTGIAPDASLYFVGVMKLVDVELDEWEMNIPGAIMTAIGALTAGDVLLLELQTPALEPIEWEKPSYDRIVIAAGLGITVVEAAGNGNLNLDAPYYSTGNGGHWPFTQAQDSGAILVGGAAAPAAFGGSTVERSRLTFSNYGATVDLQGWGEGVVTTGYGDLYGPGVNSYFAAGWGGTSAASPIVAGACALLQSAHKARTGGVLTPAQVKQRLQQTGTSQQAGLHPASENIGRLPNVKAAIDSLFPPVITFGRDRNTLTISWKSCCTLQMANHLGPNATWTDVPTTGTSYTYTHGPRPNPPPVFFRLVCP